MTTTLTIPGAVPEGLPGTGGSAQAGGQWTARVRKAAKGTGPAPAGKRGRGAARRGGKRKKRGRGNRGIGTRRSTPQAGDGNRGNARPRSSAATPTTIAATARTPRARCGCAIEATRRRAQAAVIVDDNRGNEAPRPSEPVIADDDVGNR